MKMEVINLLNELCVLSKVLFYIPTKLLLISGFELV